MLAADVARKQEQVRAERHKAEADAMVNFFDGLAANTAHKAFQSVEAGNAESYVVVETQYPPYDPFIKEMEAMGYHQFSFHGAYVQNLARRHKNVAT